MAPGDVDAELELPCTIGKYQLVSPVASGGAATVYLARLLGKAGFVKRVAVKVLHRHLARDPGFVAGFLDEARLAAGIHHPHVVDVYDVDAVDGQLIIVMEYIEGASFSYLLNRMAKKMPEPPLGAVCKVVHDALLGLHAAHELRSPRDASLGLIHRDVSPQNVLVGVDGLGRVTDFGIAKARGRVKTTENRDVVKGKLRYLAPEQIQRGPLDRRVDVFAAGIVLWEALTGEALFDGDTDAAILGQVLSAELVPPSTIRASVPAALDTVVMRALARKPDARFDTALAFADALEEAAGELFLRPRALGTLVSQLAARRLRRARRTMESIAERDGNQPHTDLIEELTRAEETEDGAKSGDLRRRRVSDANSFPMAARPTPAPGSTPGPVSMAELLPDHAPAPPSSRSTRAVAWAGAGVALVGGMIVAASLSGSADRPPASSPPEDLEAAPPSPVPSSPSRADVPTPSAPSVATSPPPPATSSAVPARPAMGGNTSSPPPSPRPPPRRPLRPAPAPPGDGVFMPGDI
ncbi:MAG: serine/threonine-protein kinase [Myxococcota bacterium]